MQDVIDAERLAVEGETVTFTAEVPPGLMVRADPEQLYRVLSNLIRNARQAIVASKNEGAIRVRADEDDGTWWIRVCGTGPGLPKRAQEHLFTPFQGGARKGGSGLGLAISAELIRGHGGRLDLETPGEAGTRFVISMPKGAFDPDMPV